MWFKALFPEAERMIFHHGSMTNHSHPDIPREVDIASAQSETTSFHTRNRGQIEALQLVQAIRQPDL
nr:hypothetical protein CFP56_19634 [Quercus suber]